MDERGLKAAQLAREINISHVQVGNYLDGSQEPKMGILKTIADFFGVTADWLIGSGADSPESAMVLREERVRSDLEVWRDRAKAAEKELADLKMALRRLLGSDPDTLKHGHQTSSGRGGSGGNAPEVRIHPDYLKRPKPEK